MKRKLMTVSLLVVAVFAAINVVSPLLGGPHFVISPPRFYYVSQVHDDNENTTCAVEFGGATFRFVYWRYPRTFVVNGTAVFATDAPMKTHFDIEVSAWKASDVTVYSGGYVLVHPLAPPRVVTVEYNGRLCGVGTADTPSLWDKWVFVVSL